MTHETTAFNVFATASNHSNGSADPLVAKLRSFHKLQSGWSYGRGRQITALVTRRAETVLNLGRQLHLTSEVFPGTDGDVVVALHFDNQTCVQVRVNADLSLGMRVEQGHGFDYEEIAEPVDRMEDASLVYTTVMGLLKKDDHEWKSPASSTSSTLVQFSVDPSILRSRTLAK